MLKPLIFIYKNAIIKAPKKKGGQRPNRCILCLIIIIQVIAAIP